MAAFTLGQVDAAGDEQRAVGMAEIVEAQRLQAGCVTGSLESAA